MKSTRRSGYEPLCKGAVPFDVVQARRFELVDQDGRIRGGLGFTDDGDPALLLFENRAGRLVVRAELGLADEGPRFRLFNAESKARVMVGLAGDMVGLMLIDDRNQCIGLTLDPNGVTLGLNDSRGQFLHLGLDEEGVVSESDGAGHEEWLERLVGGGGQDESS